MKQLLGLMWLVMFSLSASANPDNKTTNLQRQLSLATPGTQHWAQTAALLVKHCWLRCPDVATKVAPSLQVYVADHQDIGLAKLYYGYYPRTLERAGLTDQAEQQLQAGLAMLQTNEHDIDYARVLYNLATVYSKQGQFLLASNLFEQTLAIYTQYEDKNAIASNLNNLGWVNQLNKDYPAALNFYNQSIQVANSFEPTSNLANTYRNVGEIYTVLRNYEEAENYFQLSRSTYQLSDYPQDVLALDVSIASSLIAQEKYQPAVIHLERVIRSDTPSSLKVHAKVLLARAQLGLGDQATAIALSESAYRQAEQVGSRSVLLEVYHHHALILRAVGNIEAAVKVLEQKLTLVKGRNFVQEKTVVLALSELYASSARPNQAYQLLLDLVASQSTHNIEFYMSQLAQYEVMLRVNERESRAKELKLSADLMAAAHQRQVFLYGLILFIVAITVALLWYWLRSRTSKAEAAAANAAYLLSEKRNMLSEISHEIKTPLSILKLQLEALEHGLEPSTEQGYKAMHQRIEGIDMLVQDLANLSLSDAGSLILQQGPVNMASFADYCERSARAIADANNHTIAFDFQRLTNLVPRFDQQRMRQVALNLIQNSCHYTHAQGLILIGLVVDDDALKIVIEDTAPGVQEHDLNLLVQRAYRAASSQLDEPSGRGLGLSIVKAYVDAHGGELSINPSAMGGLKVCVQIPVTEKVLICST